MATRATRRVTSGSRHLQRAGLDPPFELDEAKLRAPELRRGIVFRVALVEKLLASQSQPAIAVVAPAGYGKSTLLAQWAEHRRPRVAWLSLDDRDNDPTVLLTYLAAALNRVQRIEPTVFRPLASLGAGVADVARLASSIAATGARVVLVLDHVEALTSAECKDMIAELILRLPSGSQVAMGSRHEVPLPVPRLRAEGNIVEIGVADLAMHTSEAGSLLVRSRGRTRGRSRSGLGGENRRVAGGTVPGSARDERRQCEHRRRIRLHGRGSIHGRLSPDGVSRSRFANATSRS